MKYIRAYYENEDKINECEAAINDLKTQLEDLEDDYKILHTCKQKLAASSVIFTDIGNQCADIKYTFNRGAIQSKYDHYQIFFNKISDLFGFLDNITKSTDKFNLSCDDTKSVIDRFGSKLDAVCADVAKDAQKTTEEITTKNNLKASLIAKRSSLMIPETTNNSSNEKKSNVDNSSSSAKDVYSLNPIK